MNMACRGCDTVHESVREMASVIEARGGSTFLQRAHEQRAPCKYGEEGVCCTLCPDGACRIRKDVPRGRCGIDADGMAARNLLRLVNQGGAAYTHDFKHSIATLRSAAREDGHFRIRDENKLRWFANVLQLAEEGLSAQDLALRVADFLDAEFCKDVDAPLDLIRRIAPAGRSALWEKLGVLPGGYLFEGHEAAAKCMPNIDTDYVDLSLTSLRLALSAGFLGNVATTVVRDIVLGSPDITTGEADIGVLDPDYVNVILHGHVPWMGAALGEIAKSEANQVAARAVGAKGIKLYGSLCTGQELTQRPETAKLLDGQVGNWLSQEFVAATGVADLFVMEKNCSTPGLAAIVEQLKLHTRLVPVNPAVRLRDVQADKSLNYDPTDVAKQAQRIVDLAIETYTQRSRDYAPYVPQHKTPYVAGFGIESILRALGGTPEPLVAALRSGVLKGVVGLVSCVTSKTGHGSFIVDFLKELLAKDILVLVAGCASTTAQIEGFMNAEAVEKYAGPGLKQVCGALGVPPALNFGSCLDTGRMALLIVELANYLGVDPSRLPIVAAAPEYYNNDALIDGLLAVSLGINTYVNPLPPVAGAPALAKLLTEDLEGLLGAKLIVETDAVAAADKVAGVLAAKLAALADD